MRAHIRSSLALLLAVAAGSCGGPVVLICDEYLRVVDDLDGDGVGDVVACSYTVDLRGNERSRISAGVFSAKDGRRLLRLDLPGKYLHWGVTGIDTIPDQDRDGVPEIVVACFDPHSRENWTDVLSGRTGEHLERLELAVAEALGFEGRDATDSDIFRRYSALLGDLDDDGSSERAETGIGYVGAGYGTNVEILSGADSGLVLRTIDVNGARFGVTGGLAAIEDLDGDGVGELALAFRDRQGWVGVFSSRSGDLLVETPPAPAWARFIGGSLARLPDLDGDGVSELATGCSRDEGVAILVLSGRTGAFLNPLH